MWLLLGSAHMPRNGGALITSIIGYEWQCFSQFVLVVC